jgi:hypothetical protein
VHSLMSDNCMEEKRSRSPLALTVGFDFVVAMGGLYVRHVFELVW